MKNEAAKIVSESLIGASYVTITMGSKAYTLYPPTIKRLCQAIRHFSEIDIQGESILDALGEIPNATEHILKGLSCLLCGNESLAEELSEGSFAEMKMALKEAICLVGTDPFECAALARSVAEVAAKMR